MTKSKRTLNSIAMLPMAMFAGIAGTGVTPMQDASPIQSALLIAGLGAGLILVLAPLSRDRGRAITLVAGLVSVVVFLALGVTLGRSISWLQAAMAVNGVVTTIWAVRSAAKSAEPELDRSGS